MLENANVHASIYICVNKCSDGCLLSLPNLLDPSCLALLLFVSIYFDNIDISDLLYGVNAKNC